MLKTATDRYPDIRDAVRALCADFPDEYHREIDARRAYPEAFVEALTALRPHLTIVTPNKHELFLLTGLPTGDQMMAEVAARDF